MDRFEHEGKTYVAKELSKVCNGCAFDSADVLCAKPGHLLGIACCATNREDGRQIIWVEEKA